MNLSRKVSYFIYRALLIRRVNEGIRIIGVAIKTDGRDEIHQDFRTFFLHNVLYFGTTQPLQIQVPVHHIVILMELDPFPLRKWGYDE